MSNENGQNPVTIDVTPDTETDATPPNKPKSSKLPLIIAVLALIAVLGALVAAYRYTQEAAQDLAAINAKIERSVKAQENIKEQLRIAKENAIKQRALLEEQKLKADQQQEKINIAQKTFSEQEKLLADERQRMQQREAELRASVAGVYQRMGTSGNQWIIAEAEYLLRVASHRLSLARDIDTARSALKLADERLRDTKEPGWNAVREQIARDLGKLGAVELPDMPGIAARLIGLIDQTPQLQLNRSTAGVQPPRPEDGDTPVSQRNWDTLLDDLWKGFKSAIRIRRNDQPVQAMLPPEQQFFLYENLRQHLEAARLAVARADNGLYRDSLNNVKNWLSLYFATDHAATQRMNQAIDELASINIRPDLPDITQSLAALQARRQLNNDLSKPLPGGNKDS